MHGASELLIKSLNNHLRVLLIAKPHNCLDTGCLLICFNDLCMGVKKRTSAFNESKKKSAHLFPRPKPHPRRCILSAHSIYRQVENT
jgi:hypothetical protein